MLRRDQRVCLYNGGMKLTIETERETDGRWIADIPELPGVMVYGATREDALEAAKALALRVIADRIEHGESPHPLTEVGFVAA
jgi:predicted RNase H-like HicB family nuclease